MCVCVCTHECVSVSCCVCKSTLSTCLGVSVCVCLAVECVTRVFISLSLPLCVCVCVYLSGLCMSIYSLCFLVSTAADCLSDRVESLKMGCNGVDLQTKFQCATGRVHVAISWSITIQHH